MNLIRNLLVTAVTSLALSGVVQAQQPSAQFSGLAVQSGPQGKTREAKIYVGDNRVRLERSRAGLTTVEIYDMKDRQVTLLVPQQQIYMQRDLPAGRTVSPMVAPENSNPCTGVPESSCKKVGEDSLYGRRVSQWEMRVERDGEVLRSLHWTDDQRHMSLRDVWPNGSVTESVLQDKETLHGRPTERWQRVTTLADGEEHTATQWYDPELQIAIREEMPGGYFREIRNIQVGEQPASLFQVPDNYERITELPEMPSDASPNTNNKR